MQRLEVVVEIFPALPLSVPRFSHKLPQQETHILTHRDLRLLGILPARRRLLDNLLQGGLEIRRLGRPQPHDSRSIAPLAQRLGQLLK